MKLIPRGPADTDVSQLVQNDEAVNSARREADSNFPQGGESTRIDSYEQAYSLQRVTELARIGDQLRADKVRQLKAQIVAGQFQVDSEETAKSILRSEVSSLLEKK